MQMCIFKLSQLKLALLDAHPPHMLLLHHHALPHVCSTLSVAQSRLANDLDVGDRSAWLRAPERCRGSLIRCLLQVRYGEEKMERDGWMG